MRLSKIAGMGLLLAVVAIDLRAQEAQALPENVVELRGMASQAHAQGEQETFRDVMKRLHELRPNNSEYMYQLVLAHAVLGELTEAFNMMLFMQRQGLSYDFDQSPDSMNLRDKNIYSYLNDLMIRAGEPLGEVTQVASLDAAMGRVEAIDWDPVRKAFLVGSISTGRVLAVREDESFNELLRADSENGLWGIHDLVVDAERNRLWLASAATPAFAGFDPVDRGRSALYELELDTLKILKRYPVPVDGLPHILGSMTLASTGDLFLADRSLPIVYTLKAGDDRLRALFASPKLVSLRDIAVSDDGQQIYVADYEMGIVRLLVGTGQVNLLGRAETLNLGGIDGLEYAAGDLLIIQNGTRPQRVLRLQLDDTGRGVQNIAPVAVALDEFDHPNYGTVVEGDLVFFANSRTSKGEEGIQPVRIVRASLAGVENIVPPDMQRYLDNQARQRMQRPAEPETTEPGAAEDSVAGDDREG